MLDLISRDGALWFTIPALVGTLVFLLRLVFLLAGAGHDFHVDVHVDAPHADGLHGGHDDSSDAFRVFSVQTVAAFLMGFGWGGLGALRGSGLDPLKSVLVGLAIGAAMMWVVLKLLRLMRRLESSGNVEIHSAVGRDGRVYLSIPERGGGRGQVRVTVDEQDRIYNAVSDGEGIPTGTPARIIRANPDNTVTVSRI